MRTRARRISRLRALPLTIGLGLGLVACWSDIEPEPSASTDTAGADAGADSGAGGPFEGVSYQEHIRPLLELNCVQCHRQGGIGPFTLESWADVEPLAAEIVQVVQSGVMPPWMPADDCADLRDERRLDEAEVALFAEWGFDGYHEGDPATYSAPEHPESPLNAPPRFEITPAAAYQPDRDLPDDYRCLPLDHTFGADTYITATDIVPGVRDMVHHVIFYGVLPDQVGAMEALDASDDGPGYTCFGGSGVSRAVMLGGWVPGSPAMVWPEGAALRLPEGSRIVAQFHYNLTNYGRDDEIPSDLSEVHIWTLPADETPEKLVEFTLVADVGILIPAGESSSVHEMELPIPLPVEVVGVLPHMHTLGEAIRVDVDRGQDNLCLVDIPSWDFSWQQLYNFPDGAPMRLHAGDTLRLTCEFDNSASNQPVVNGERAEPRDVRWGEGTFDEMCLVYVAIARPFVEGDAGLCGATMPECFRACDGDGQCAFACMLNSGEECPDCTIDGLVACGRRECLAELAVLGSCVDGCDDSDSCLTRTCAEEYDAFYQCLEPPLFEGACDADLSACDVQFAAEE
jgi:mono/diheme cytochrome c family protein